jgi:Kef-type K+ transport system membrane component KefB
MRGKLAALYLGLLAAAVGVFFAVRAVGERRALSPAQSLAAPAAAPATPGNLFHVLIALLAVLVVARVVGLVFRRFGQPPVIGEVVAGLLLGPSFMGRVAPELSSYVLPSSVTPALSVIAQVGVILYMFVVGLELDTRQLGTQTQVSITVSHASIVAPFTLGSVLALWLHPTLAPAGVPFTVFALFIGVSMSVTAFPVLARILTDRGMQRSRLGVLALACASIDDVTAWCMLAFVVGFVESRGGNVLFTLGMTAAYIAAMVVLVRPLARWLARWREARRETSQGLMGVAFGALLLSALLTEAIGIHALFGAFLLGAIVPHDSALAKDLSQKLEGLVVVLLLPAFFALTGLRTQVALLDGAGDWLFCAAIIVVASVGKWGGSTLAARASGLTWRDATALGVLMNTRGLMELIVLNVGLDLGVISPRLFAMLVLMAIVTTMLTSPVLKALKVDTAAV